MIGYVGTKHGVTISEDEMDALIRRCIGGCCPNVYNELMFMCVHRSSMKFGGRLFKDMVRGIRSRNDRTALFACQPRSVVDEVRDVDMIVENFYRKYWREVHVPIRKCNPVEYRGVDGVPLCLDRGDDYMKLWVMII